jgi:predicted signal transduction protein with EAL and GGDEF domain
MSTTLDGITIASPTTTPPELVVALRTASAIVLVALGVLAVSASSSVDADAAKRALIRGIVGFAGEAGATVVAEGIETEAEAATLRTLGVTLGQGFLFGRPARIDQIAVDGWLDEALTGA